MHTAGALLDAAVRLFAERGAQGVTMSAVAEAARAPSGSVYHRFPNRPELLAAVWRRTARRLEREYRERLGEEPTPERAVEVAGWMVGWCREHPGEAAVLHAGKGAFSPGEWSTETREAVAAEEAERDRELAAVVRAIAGRAGRPADEVAFAMLALPIAVVRRHLPEPVPEAAEDLVRRLAGRILLG